MLYALLAACAVVLVLAAIFGVIRWQERNLPPEDYGDPILPKPPGPWATHLRQTVLVSLVGGDAYRGALWDSGPEGLVLRAAELVLENRTAPVDGELLIPAHRVDVIQVVGAS